MKRKDYIDNILKTYTVHKVLSRKNDSTVLLILHKALEKYLILRSYPKQVTAYDKLKNIRHTNIATIYDAIEMEDGQIVFEEYIDGITVGEVLQSGCYKYNGAKKVIIDIGNALISLHKQQIIHRDIKPENIVIDKSGCAKLIDFNASRQYVPDIKHDTEILGTIGYASPEQFGISQSGERSDIYSLGVLLNVMLTGKHPSEMLAKGKARKIVLKCTQIDPNSRFKSVDKMLAKL